MIDDGPATILIPARRLLVVEDLGDVRAGDHVLVVANVIIAHDTSHRTSDNLLAQIASTKSAKPTARVTVKDITHERVLMIVRERGPITSREISDLIGCERGDITTRSKVTRMITLLLSHHKIKRITDERRRSFRYDLANRINETDCELPAG